MDLHQLQATFPFGWIGIALVLAVQAAIILMLKRNYLRQKKSRQRLRADREALQNKLIDQNLALKNSNALLSDALAQHEASERRLRTMKDSLRALFNAMPSMVIGVGDDGRVTHWNRASTESTGIQEADALNRPLQQVYPECPLNDRALRKVLERRDIVEIPRLQTAHKGHNRFYSMTIYPQEAGGAVMCVNDITQGVQHEHFAIQSEKSQALAELAAGLAHELNDPLSAIVQGAQVISRRLDPNLHANISTAEQLGLPQELLQRYLAQRQLPNMAANLRAAGERAALIVANLLEYSRASAESSVSVDLNQLLRHTLDLHAHTLVTKTEGTHRTIQLFRELGKVPAINCHPGELQQVIVTLLSNAREALGQCPTSREPAITVRLHREGDWALLEVEDNGPGIPAKVLPHIFEPFFTTKEPGRGTGLGLSAAFFIIRDHHGGDISVDSSEGEGSRFAIRLPLAA